MTQPNYKNSFSEHKTGRSKAEAYHRALANNELAIKSDGTRVPLKDLDLVDVEFVAGLWRVQDYFPHKVQQVRDKNVVLADKLSHTERIPFEYWRAYTVSENCYGKYLSAQPDLIVAKYQTDEGVYWGYGSTIEQARAFLGIKLFDQYMDLIHAAACHSQKNKQKK